MRAVAAPILRAAERFGVGERARERVDVLRSQILFRPTRQEL